MAIQTLFFDFGGVIIKTPSLKWLNRWNKILGFGDDPEIIEMLENPNGSKLVQEICLGNITEDQVWVMMAEKWHVNPKLINKIRRRLFTKRRLNKTLIRFIETLGNHYQVAILSNAGDQTRRVMEQVYHLDRVVDEIIISAEEGVIKPDERIFQIALERMNARPETSLLLDDYLVNVNAARSFGMKAVQFINNYQAIQTIEDLLGSES